VKSVSKFSTINISPLKKRKREMVTNNIAQQQNTDVPNNEFTSHRNG
jgi:hypothetical protein